MSTKKILIIFLLTILTSLVYSTETYSAIGGDYYQIGGKLYAKYCSVCHGKKGLGDGANSENMDPIPRDLTDSGKDKYMAKLTNEDLFKSISLGGRGIDKSGLMPPFGKTLSEKEIWIIVSYVKKLYKGSPNVDFSKQISNDRPKVVIKDVNIEPPDRRAILNGKRAYGRFGCSGCHKIKGRGGISGPDLSKIGRKLKSEVIYRVTQSAEDMDEDSSMPVYALPEKAGVSITRYLMSLE